MYQVQVARHHLLPSYSLLNYLAYTLYVPLYIAGPIITFNSFVSQLSSPSYAIRISGVRGVPCVNDKRDEKP